MELTIIEQNGWKKSVEFKKAIIRIGSDSANDVQLPSSQIAPVQLQIHYLQENPSSCKVLNLGGDVVVWQNQSQTVLPPYSITHINNGSEIVMGEYRIQFKLPFAASTISESHSIQAFLSFPDAVLRLDKIAVGVLSLKNTGVESACQFEVGLQGLPPDCMQVDPVPLLYPGAQEDVKVQLFHRKLYPAAGAQELTVIVSSPGSYPGEQVIIRQGIYVAPVLEHSVKIIDDMVREEQLEDEQGVAAGVPGPIPDQISAPPVIEEVISPVGIVAPLPPVESQPIISAPPAETKPQPSSVIMMQPESVAPQTTPENLQNTAADSVPGTSPSPPLNKKPEIITEISSKPDIPLEKSESEPDSSPRPKPRVVHSPSDDFWDEE
jgi:hypothetical protein